MFTVGDVRLTDTGRNKQGSGEDFIKKRGIDFEHCYTSVVKACHVETWIALENEMDDPLSHRGMKSCALEMSVITVQSLFKDINKSEQTGLKNFWKMSNNRFLRFNAVYCLPYEFYWQALD